MHIRTIPESAWGIPAVGFFAAVNDVSDVSDEPAANLTLVFPEHGALVVDAMAHYGSGDDIAS